MNLLANILAGNAIRPNMYRISMLETEGWLVCVALLLMTMRLGMNPVPKFLKGLCLIWLEKAKLLKFTESDLSKDKRNKKNRTVSSEKAKESLSFQTVFVKEESISAVPFQLMFRLFFAFFMTSVALLLTSIVISLTSFKDVVWSFVTPAVLSFGGMCLIAVMASFMPHDRIRQLIFPILCGMSLSGVLNVFPVGPCDISLLIPDLDVARILAATAGAVLGSVFFLTVTRFGKMKKMIAEPFSGIYQVEVMRRHLQLMREMVGGKVEFLHGLCPANVFAYLCLRYFFPKISWYYFDAGFWIIEIIAVYLRVLVAKECVQLWVFSATIVGLMNLNEKRTTRAVDYAIKRNQRSIDSICPTFIGFLVHPFAIVFFFLVYVLSLLVSGYARAQARILSVAGACACDFIMAYFMFASVAEPSD